MASIAINGFQNINIVYPQRLHQSVVPMLEAEFVIEGMLISLL